jgi:hypothetical protein
LKPLSGDEITHQTPKEYMISMIHELCSCSGEKKTLKVIQKEYTKQHDVVSMPHPHKMLQELEKHFICFGSLEGFEAIDVSLANLTVLNSGQVY